MDATSKGKTTPQKYKGKDSCVNVFIRNHPKLICKTERIKICFSPLVGEGEGRSNIGQVSRTLEQGAAGQGLREETQWLGREVHRRQAPTPSTIFTLSIEAAATRTKKQIWCWHLWQARSRIRVRAWPWTQQGRRLEGAYSVRRGERGGGLRPPLPATHKPAHGGQDLEAEPPLGRARAAALGP